jgi:hypothetical protein
MKTFRIILLIILGILDMYFAYATVGYIVKSFDYPKIVGEGNVIFCGLYIMSATFFVAFIITTIIYVSILKKLLKMEKHR